MSQLFVTYYVIDIIAKELTKVFFNSFILLTMEKKDTQKTKNTATQHQIKQLNEEAWALNRQSPKKSIDLAKKALELAIHSNDLFGKANSLFIMGTAQIWISAYEESMQNIHAAKQYFEQIKDYQSSAKCAYSLGSCYFYLSDYEEALKQFFDSLNLYEKANDIIGQADAYNGIGSVYSEFENYQEALSVLEKSWAILQNENAEHISVKVMHGLGEVTFMLNQLEDSTAFFEECIKICEANGHYQVLIFAHEGLAKIYNAQKKYLKAHESIDIAIEMAKQIEFKIGLARSLYLKGKFYLEEHLESNAFKFFNEAIQIVEEIDSVEVRCKYHKLMSTYYEEKKNFELTVYHLKSFHKYQDKQNKQKHGLHLKSLQIQINLERSEKQNEIYKTKNKELTFRTEFLKESNDRIKTIAELGQIIASKLELEELLNVIYEQINKLMIADALYIGLYDVQNQVIDFPFYIKENVRIHDIQVSMNNTGKFTVWCIKNEKELVMNDFNREASEYITLTKEKNAEKPPASVLIIPIKVKDKMIGVIGVHSYTKNSFTKEKVSILKTLGAYVSIALENAKGYKRINDLYELIEIKNKEIIDSINYAKRLQSAILPTTDTIHEWLPNSYVIYKPKAVVSGDFYWFERLNNYTYIAVADCTGHGVPGAMVSMVCSNALNRTVNEFDMIEPAQILNKTRELVIETFAKSGEVVKDGMDIALCAIKDGKIIYAGGNNPLWIIRKTVYLTELQKQNHNTIIDKDLSLIEFRPNKQPIGLHIGMKDFTQEEIPIFPEDIMYIFTDGFADQFGGNKNKKFKYKPFKKYLINIQKHPFQLHQRIIEQTFEDWRGEAEQVDDICIIGIKLESSN